MIASHTQQRHVEFYNAENVQVYSDTVALTIIIPISFSKLQAQAPWIRPAAASNASVG